jgi:hypothetical protein
MDVILIIIIALVYIAIGVMVGLMFEGWMNLDESDGGEIFCIMFIWPIMLMIMLCPIIGKKLKLDLKDNCFVKLGNKLGRLG